MEFAEKELLRRIRSTFRIYISGWGPSSCCSSEQSIKHNEQACLFAWYNHPLTTEKRCSSIKLQWWAFWYRLQPLVPSRTAWYLEPAFVCSSCHVILKGYITIQQQFYLQCFLFFSFLYQLVNHIFGGEEIPQNNKEAKIHCEVIDFLDQNNCFRIVGRQKSLNSLL